MLEFIWLLRQRLFSTYSTLCNKGPFIIYTREWAGKIHQKAQKNILTRSKENSKKKKLKKGMTPLNVLLKTS